MVEAILFVNYEVVAYNKEPPHTEVQAWPRAILGLQ